MNLLPECSDSDGKTLYPLYLQITYNRKNTQIRSKYGKYYENLNDQEIRDILLFECSLAEKLVRCEINNTKKEYSLAGLGGRYEVYATSIAIVIGEYLIGKMKFELKRMNSPFYDILNFENKRKYFEDFYNASLLLFKDFDKKISKEFKHEINIYQLYRDFEPISMGGYNFPTITDWIYGNYKQQFEQKLGRVFKNNNQIVETIEFIDKLIHARLQTIKK
ncbi:MAG: hypothetical protein J0L87_15475 [Bacteroidetes bacterium]|nr:hypothetical protein [Bacteroidota bacterium]